MTRARMPRPHEVAAARRDPRLLRAFHERDEDLTWRARGVCQGVDPEVFFPAPSEPADAAIALCRTCDVQGACLAWALEVGDCHGVWGATTPRERRAMLVAWRSDEFDAFDAFEAAAASRGPFAGDSLSPVLHPPRQTDVVGPGRAPRIHVPSQRNGHDTRNALDTCNASEPRSGSESRGGIETRNGAVVRDEAESRLGAGIAASA
jgi:WhiB family transcriptional regulator, redox-sensing transcriptional regulator